MIFSVSVYVKIINHESLTTYNRKNESARYSAGIFIIRKIKDRKGGFPKTRYTEKVSPDAVSQLSRSEEAVFLSGQTQNIY
jgi:hypothetical protein